MTARSFDFSNVPERTPEHLRHTEHDHVPFLDKRDRTPLVDKKPAKAKLTEEQVQAIKLFLTGDSVAVEAGAGTGKTHTLREMAKRTQKRGQYVAFNKAIVQEAVAKFPDHVKANTAHSLAFRAKGVDFGRRLRNSQRMRSADIARHIGLTSWFNAGDKRLSPSSLAAIASRTAVRFCQSADEQITTRHVSYQEGLDEPGPGGTRTYANNNLLAEFLVPYARRVWEDGINPMGVLPYKHDYYLKLFERSNPKIAADFILFDEAQDASPVLVSIVQQQTAAQVVWVGDSNQQIYGFTGAVNALRGMDVKHRSMLTQSFRFGQTIADEANYVLGMLPTDMVLRGFPPINSTVGPIESPRAILCRTNAATMMEYFAARALDRKPYIVGGGDAVVAFAKAAQSLQTQGWTPHPELACFRSWGEVQDYVKSDEQGDELALMVRLIDQFGVDQIIAELDAMVPERQADLVISTAHKAKGLEWPSVRLGPDFPVADPDDPEPNHEELRLLYVAITRAQRELDCSLAFGTPELEDD